jgi:hypothetical protein
MNLWEVIDRHPGLTCFALLVLTHFVWLPFRAFFRHLNIRRAGWPAHCDAGCNRKDTE